MPDIFFVLCIAAIGGFIGHKFKLPVGGMLGAIAAVLAFNLLFEPGFYLPVYFRVALQLSFGPLIGSRVTKEDLIGLKKLAFPAAVMVICMLCLNVTFGIIMYRISDLDIVTSLFATAPGGMMDMTIISADLGANYVYVALIQLSRTMFVITCMFPFYQKALIKLKTGGVASVQADSPSITPEGRPPEPSSIKRKAIRFFSTAFCGCFLGLVFWNLNIPAGAIIGALIGGAAFNVITGNGYFPPRLRLPMQIFAGSFIGAGMDRQSLLAMGEVIVPIVIVVFYVIIITVTTAYIVHKLTGMDAFTSLMATTPGGLGEMSMLADGLKVDMPKVVVMHMARLMSVIILFPFILSFIIWLIALLQ